MSRKLMYAIVVAAAASLLAACGGSGGGSTTANTTASTASAAVKASNGSNSSTSTAAPAARASGEETVDAAHDGFSTILPRGFTDGLTHEEVTNGLEYRAVGPRVHGFATNVLVFRAPASGKDVAALAKRALHNLSTRPSFLPHARGISSLHALSVDGEPALALVYQFAGRKPSYRRQVFVVHGEWAYEISDNTSPTGYAASLATLGEVLRNWRWQ
jgi:hypothetical protein